MPDEDPILFKPFPAAVKAEPKITIHDDLGDDPDSHRWRAYWQRDYDGTITGIELVPYPVIKLTPQGAQIDPRAWRGWPTAGRGWYLTGDKRFVTNTGDQAWAKPTQERALHSVAVRLHRWASRLRRDVDAVHQAAKVLKAIRPDDAWIGKEATNQLDFTPTAWSDEAIANMPEYAMIGLVMKLTGGSANPEVIRGQIQHARERAKNV